MSKKTQIKAVRGMKDLLPVDSDLWLRVEAVCATVMGNYSYKQIRTPILESTHLFSRSIGEDTDVVSKEMYTFEDRNGDSLTLRPEGTASCVRAGIEHGLFYNQQQRLWYVGPMFRHERPQKGRYRQFTQIGAECYGWSSPDVEAELIGLTAEIFERLGLRNTRLIINSLGSAEARINYRSALVDYLSNHEKELDDDSIRRLKTNPLRILDSKNSNVQRVLESAPKIIEYLDDDSSAQFAKLQSYLTSLGIEYTVDHRLVRGLDYYNDTVFEWVNEEYGAQATVCGGGRYDQMVEQLGGAKTECFGFAMGLERLVEMLQEQSAEISLASSAPDVFIVSIGELARKQAIVLQKKLVRQSVSCQLFCGMGSMKNQFKKADKSGAKVVLIIGEDEAQNSMLGIRPLRKSEQHIEQKLIKQIDAHNAVTNLLETL